MSADLVDLRAKITVETHCALAAEARALDVDRAEVVRAVLHEWAMKRIHGASVLNACLRAKGLGGALQGTSAQPGETLTFEDDAP